MFLEGLKEAEVLPVAYHRSLSSLINKAKSTIFDHLIINVGPKIFLT